MNTQPPAPMNAAHTPATPGPWIASRFSRRYYIVPAEQKSNFGIVAEVSPVYHRNSMGGKTEVPNETEANAQLIASAPTLLAQRNELREALQEAVTYSEITRSETGAPLPTWIQQARKAIASATP